MPLLLTPREHGDVYIIEAQGRVTMGEELETLEAELRTATRNFARIVIDAEKVTRVDSMGLGSLVKHATNLHKVGGDLRLAAPQPFLMNLLKISHLSSVMRVYETEEAAIRSFLERQPTERVEKHGTRVLFFDQSQDLGAFVRTVLTQHGFDVKSTVNFGDAKTLLRVEVVEYVLVGPGTPQLSGETALRGLRAASPRSKALQLPADFNSQDAGPATETLLGLFPTGTKEQTSA